MVYILNLIFTVGYSYFKKGIKIFHFLPILILWTLILGGQYEVGTDYRNYLNFFYGIRDIKLFYLQKEYIFYYFLKITSSIFSNGQIIFIIIGGLESFLFIYFIKKSVKNKILNKEKVYIFLFLYLAYGTTFYNQMNGLRQYFNIYLFSLAVIYTLEKNIINYFGMNIIAIFIHRSTYLLFPFYFIYKYIIKKFDRKSIYIAILLISLFVSLINIIDILEIVVAKYIPKFQGYFMTGRIKEVAFEKKIIKYVYFPFYILSINLLDIKNGKAKEMLKIGILAYAARIITVNITIVNRIGEYFVLLSIFPIFYLIEDWIKKKKYILVIGLVMMIIIIFLLKVTIFARGEYYYRSCLFN